MPQYKDIALSVWEFPLYIDKIDGLMLERRNSSVLAFTHRDSHTIVLSSL